MSEQTHKAAHRYADYGWAVLAVRQSGKAPSWLKGLQHKGCNSASSDHDWIDAVWQAKPHVNVGIATGAKSGIFVLDVDTMEALDALSELGELPDTYTVRTPGGGLHFYFHHVTGIINRRFSTPAGVDIRGEGGYVVAPPSVIPKGSYSVHSAPFPGGQVADPPAWLVNKIFGREVVR